MASVQGKERKKDRKEIFLIGIGMGSLGQITWEGIEALLCSDAWLGASRMMEGGKKICQPFLINQYRVFNENTDHSDRGKIIPLEDKLFCTDYHPKQIRNWLLAHPQVKRPAVLFSGDVGFYSGAKGLERELKENGISFIFHRIPGISSLSYFAAKIGRSWEGVRSASFHGREEILDWSFPDGKEWFLLLDGCQRLHWVCRRLLEHGQREADLWVGEWFSYPKEQIVCGKPEEVLLMEFSSLLAVWIVPKNNEA